MLSNKLYAIDYARVGSGYPKTDMHTCILYTVVGNQGHYAQELYEWERYVFSGTSKYDI